MYPYLLFKIFSEWAIMLENINFGPRKFVPIIGPKCEKTYIYGIYGTEQKEHITILD